MADSNAAPDRGSTISISLILGSATAALLLANFLMTPRLDPREPPLLKPSIPWIGHIIGVISHQANYHRILKKTHSFPIASLQMLWGRIYAIWDPLLAQAALRSRAFSFDPFIVDFVKKAFSLRRETFAKINDEMLADFNDGIHAGMKTSFVLKMNANALNFVSKNFDGIREDRLEIPNLYLWLRDLVSLATTRALFGKENPFEKDPGLLDDMCVFETHLPILLTRPFASLTAKKGIAARERLTKACGDYYTAEHDINDPEVAAILRYRANALRKHGWTGEEIGRPEIMLPVVGTTNTVPIMFWILYNIFRTPGLAARIREESEPLVQHDEDHDVATLDISRMEKECPLLVSCYRETLRLANQGSSMRRVMTDTTISDGRGNTYLMKKGVDVQIPLGIAHSLESAWGPNVATFDPERFLPGKTQPGDDKLSKAAYIPFGGGKHLCPGRYFAFAEILAVASTIALGFEVEPIDGKFPEVAAAGATFASTAVKPVNDGAGFGIVIRRREGWEDRKWRYLS